MNWSRVASWAMLAVGVIGFFVTFPLWIWGAIGDRTMLGLTLALSWMALWYAAICTLFITGDN